MRHAEECSPQIVGAALWVQIFGCYCCFTYNCYICLIDGTYLTVVLSLVRKVYR
jgi:hypothetical protein